MTGAGELDVDDEPVELEDPDDPLDVEEPPFAVVLEPEL